MDPRTDMQKLTQEPITVTLGGKEYPIAPLVIKYSGEWRKKSMPLIAFLMSYSRLSAAAKAAGSNTEALEAATTELFTDKTDEIIESFFEYGRDLPRPEIEETATDGEIIVAFLEVFDAFVSPLSATARAIPETPPTT